MKYKIPSLLLVTILAGQGFVSNAYAEGRDDGLPLSKENKLLTILDPFVRVLRYLAHELTDGKKLNLPDNDKLFINEVFNAFSKILDSYKQPNQTGAESYYSYSKNIPLEMLNSAKKIYKALADNRDQFYFSAREGSGVMILNALAEVAKEAELLVKDQLDQALREKRANSPKVTQIQKPKTKIAQGPKESKVNLIKKSNSRQSLEEKKSYASDKGFSQNLEERETGASDNESIHSIEESVANISDDFSDKVSSQNLEKKKTKGALQGKERVLHLFEEILKTYEALDEKDMDVTDRYDLVSTRAESYRKNPVKEATAYYLAELPLKLNKLKKALADINYQEQKEKESKRAKVLQLFTEVLKTYKAIDATGVDLVEDILSMQDKKANYEKFPTEEKTAKYIPELSKLLKTLTNRLESRLPWGIEGLKLQQYNKGGKVYS